MADETNGKKPRILSLGEALEKAARPINGKYDLARSNEVVDADQQLQAQINQIRDVITAMRETVNVHQVALVELVPIVQSLEARTVRGRMKRARAWLDLQRESLRGIGIELGILSPMIIENPRNEPLPPREPK